ncbi:hypothetical protein [Roseibium sp.]|uniref:hypothetical protein n=1 Tax=Roseibium sp. TaxID=1936156 RepID=UPI003266A6FA
MSAGNQGICAHNNAIWCDAVLKAAGAKTGFHPGFWQAEDRLQPLHPNIVTLSEAPGAGFKQALAALPKEATVKDSFDTLGLGPLGFRKLFSGTWLFRPAQTERKAPIQPDWHKITHPDALKKWAVGWNGNEQLQAVFSPRLLASATIDFAAIMKEDAIRAGAVFSSGPRLDGKDVVGLSNLFCRRNWRYSALHGLLAPYAHRPVCAYETDDGLMPVYGQLGFQTCGRLSVWIKTAA